METLNHECYVSLETAKLLKEAGFDWWTDRYYGSTAYLKRTHTAVSPDEHKANAIYWKENTTLVLGGHKNDDSLSYSAPTLDVAQRWLREVKGVDVFAYRNKPKDKFESVVSFKHAWSTTGMRIDSYEEALEAGTKKALERILEKGE